MQYSSGDKYSTMNVHRSALALLCSLKPYENIINRFLKGVYKNRPSFSRYKFTWDPHQVLLHLGSLGPTHDLDLATVISYN